MNLYFSVLVVLNFQLIFSKVTRRRVQWTTRKKPTTLKKRETTEPFREPNFNEGSSETFVFSQRETTTAFSRWTTFMSLVNRGRNFENVYVNSDEEYTDNNMSLNETMEQDYFQTVTEYDYRGPKERIGGTTSIEVPEFVEWSDHDPTLPATVTHGIEAFEGKKSVLFLCRDNYIRSPILKSMFMDLLEKTNQTENWVVESAGIGWWDVGKGMDPRAIEFCDRFNIKTEHIAREIEKDDFYKFQYIVATDENDFTFLGLEAPEDKTAQLVMLGKYNQIKKFPGKNYLEDPYHLKSKGLKLNIEELINKGYWLLVGFLDANGVTVPSTTPVTKRTTTLKAVKSTVNKYKQIYANMMAK